MKREIVVIGTGKIGRGSVALFFSRAGWKVDLYGHSPEKMADLKAQGYYETRTETGVVSRVEDFEVLDCTTDDELIQKLCEVNVAALALYEGAFPEVGASIGKAIKARVAEGITEPLNFMLCVNAPRAIEELEEHFLSDLSPAEEEHYRSCIGMCFTMVASLGANPPEGENPWLVLTSDSGHLEVDKDEWKGELVEGVDRVSYITNGRGIIYRKVFVGNMGHAMQAFIASAHGNEFMDEGINEDAWAQKNVALAKDEALFGVTSEFEFDAAELAEFKAHMNDAHAAAHDPIARVANSPEKKISRTNRYIWPALACIKHGKLPYFLARGTAYGLLYIVNGHGAEAVVAPTNEGEVRALVERFCGLSDEDALLRDLIVAQYMDIPETGLIPVKQN